MKKQEEFKASNFVFIDLTQAVMSIAILQAVYDRNAASNNPEVMTTLTALKGLIDSLMAQVVKIRTDMVINSQSRQGADL